VDLGQTQARVRFVDGRGRVVLDSVRDTPSSALASSPERTALAILDHAAADAPGATVTSVAFGMTGLHGRPTAGRAVLDHCRARYGTRRILVADDSVTSYVGAVGTEAAVVCAAGTGTVVLATDGSSVHARIDGWGWVAGDLGSGSWIARQGVTLAFKALDGRPGSVALLERLGRRYGDPVDLARRSATAPDGAALLAPFAEDVAAAAHDGDRLAREIWVEAAGHLADSILAAHASASPGLPLRIALSGRLFDAGELLTGPLRAAVTGRADGAEWLVARGTGLDGAVALAATERLPAVFGPLLTTAGQEDGVA
jgi:glucosamine kinase